MNYFAVVISVGLIIYAVVIFVKWIRNMLRGRCCEGCSNCPSSDMCEASEKKENHDK